jgi:hypothetical protein
MLNSRDTQMQYASSCGTESTSSSSAELLRARKAEVIPPKAAKRRQRGSFCAPPVPVLCHALAPVLVLLGLGENARAEDNALSARADDAAKSAISAPPPAPPPVPLGVFCDNNVPQGRFVLSITPIFAGLSGILIGTRGYRMNSSPPRCHFFSIPAKRCASFRNISPLPRKVFA